MILIKKNTVYNLILSAILVFFTENYWNIVVLLDKMI